MSKDLVKPTGRKPGIYSGISNEHYHADPDSYSSSIIKMMSVPARVKYALENPPKYKECFRIGSAIHKWILERDRFLSEFLVGIQRPRRSAADKAEWGQWFTEHGAKGDEIITRPAAEWNGLFQLQSSNSMVTPEELQNIIDMAEAVAANKLAVNLLSGGEAEQSVYWNDIETGLNLRCRPDYLNNDFASDLKSCQSVEDHHITRAFANLGYGVSQAMYQDGINKILADWRPFLFIFVEKDPPHLTRVISLDQDAQSDYWEKYNALKARLANCLRTDSWPGLPDDLDLALPTWVTN